MSPPARGRAPTPPALDQLLAADLEDVPLADALAAIAARLGLQLENGDAAEPSARITAKVPRVSAEVLLLVLAWQTNREWVPAEKLLRWGPAQDLPSAELAKYRRERALRLERKASLLRRRLSEPLRFHLKVEDVPLADLLRFLQRELSLPLFLDPRAAAELSAPVRQQFAERTLAELLDRLLSAEGVSPSAGDTADGGASGPSGSPAHEPPHPGAEGRSAPASTEGSGPLGWAVVGDLVVVSTPAHLYSLKSLRQ